jgi:hypothetical protein
MTMGSEGRKAKRRIPVWLMVAVPLFTVGLALVAVSFAWRSGSASEEDGTDPSPVPTQEVSSELFLACTDCHGDLDRVFKTGGSDLLYRHEKHFAAGVSECSTCHPATTHEADKINKPTMTRCFICHGLTKNAIAPGTCATCHPPGSARQPESHLESTWVAKDHQDQALDDRFQCLTCHTEQTCAQCHGLELPHPSRWEQAPHVETYFDDPALCERCHQVIATAPQTAELPARSLCDSCHHPAGPEDETWLSYHFNVVYRKGATTCFQCHATDTCATCHRTDALDLTADEQRWIQENPS